MKRSKRYLACFLAMLMAVGSINIGLATDITISTKDLNSESEEITTQSDQLETNTVSGNSIEEDIILENEVQSNDELLSSNSDIQLTIENDDLEPSETDNWELDLVFYDSSVDSGKTPLTEINWDASNEGYNQGETRTITVQINYKIENINTLNPGDLEISIPNLIYNASENSENSPLWDTSVLLGANDSTHSGYEWNFISGDIANTTQENYVFQNAIAFESSVHQGSIQIIYTIIPKEECSPAVYDANIEEYENECFHIRDLEIFAIINKSVQSNCINFHYERTYIHPWEKVQYKLTQTAEKIVSYDGLSDDAENYIWIKYNFIVEATESSLSYPYIHANNFYILNDIPTDCLVYKNGELIENYIKINVSFSEYFGSVNNKYIPISKAISFKDSVYVGYPKDSYQGSAIFGESSELYGTYKNSTNEKLSESFININLSEFEFKYDETIETGLYNISTYKDYNSQKRLRYQDIVTPEKYSSPLNKTTWKIGFVSKYKGIPMTLKIGDDALCSTNLDGSITMLSDNEYYFTAVNFDGNQFTNGSGIKINPNKYDCELYVRYSNQNEYILYDSFKNPNNNKNWTFKEKVSSWYIIIYDVTETIQFDYTQNNDNMNGYGLKNILSSSTVLTKNNIPNSGSIYNFVYMNVYYRDGDNFVLQNETSEDLYQSEITKNLLEYDLSTYGHCMQRNYAEDGWNYFTPTTYGGSFSAETSFNEIKQDNEHEKFVGSNNITAIFDVTSAGHSQSMEYVEELDSDYMMQGFKMYDLLPAGMELTSSAEDIINSFKVTAHDYHRLHNEDGTLLSGGNASIGSHLDILKNAIDTNVMITENWNNTGRTRIEITGILKEKLWVTSYYWGCWYKFSYQYDYSIPYESYMEYGNVYINNLYVDKFDTQTKGYSIKNIVKDNGSNDLDAVDIDEDGNTQDNLSLGKDNLTINAIFSTYQNISLKAKTDLSNYNTNLINSSYDSEYTYRLGITTGSNYIKNVIFYDNLEQAFGGNSYWNGEFLGIDTSYAENKGYIVKTYYSENKEANNLYDENHYLNSEWKEYTDSVDKDKIKSLAFEFLDNKGDSAIIPSSTLMYILINMKSPSDNTINTLAYNKFFTQWNSIDSLGFVSNEITTLNSNTLKIALPNSFKSFGSYVLKHEYYVRDRKGNLRLENTISEKEVEDVIEGTEINTYNLEHIFDNNSYIYKLLEDNSIIIESNTTKDVIIKYVRDEYVFCIEWNDSSNELRPETYIVSLKQDGVIVETKEISSSENQYIFNNYSKFDEEGNEHIYEFDVNIGERYDLIYDSDRDIYVANYKESSFNIIIPKIIILDGNTGRANYQILINGDLYYNDNLRVEPTKNFILIDKNKIFTINANIQQEKVLFVKEDIIEECRTIGLIETEKTNFSGEWTGTFNFDISLQRQN